MTKVFPRSRICVIDCYPSFEKGLKVACTFARNNNVSLNSADGQKIILSFCLQLIDETYKNTKSSFPKVLCISKKAITKKISSFIDQHFDKIMERYPVPYCGKYDLDSPDLEFAAENSLNQQKSQKNFRELMQKLKIKSAL